MLIIFAVNFNKKLVSYSQLMSKTKIVNKTQGLTKKLDDGVSSKTSFMDAP